MVCLYIGIPFPSPLCMWVRLFHPKKKKFKKSSIRSIWSYSIHSVYIGLIRSILVLLCPFQSYSVPIGSIWPIIDPILSTLVQFCPLQSYLVQIGPIWSSLSTSILFSPFCPLRSYSVHSFLFSPIQFPSVLFGPPCFYLVLFCPFGPLCSIRSIWPIWSILDHFDLFLCTYKIGKDIFRLKEKLVFFTINAINTIAS